MNLLRVGLALGLCVPSACGGSSSSPPPRADGGADAATEGGADAGRDGGGGGGDSGAPTTTRIGPEGGEVTGPGGVVLEFPPNAVSEEVEIAVSAAPADCLHENYDLVGMAYALEPAGLELERPIAARLPYDVEALGPRVNERKLVAVFTSDGGETWENLGNAGYAGTLVARVSKLGCLSLGLRQVGACTVEMQPSMSASAARQELAWSDLGEPTLLAMTRDTDGDGTADQDSRETYTYDAEGRPTKRTAVNDVEADGTPSSVRTETWTYADDADDSYTHVIEQDDDGDGTPDSIVTETGKGLWRVTSLRREEDDDGDGDVDSVTRIESTWDDRGRSLTSRQEIDHDADGTFEGLVERISTYEWFTQATLQDRRDYEGDGTYEYDYQFTRTFDSLGRILTEDSSSESVTQQETTQATHTYESMKRVHVRRTDTDEDGVVDEITTDTVTYDAEGKTIEHVTSVDRATTPGEQPDGQVDERTTLTYSYSNGRRAVFRQERDSDGDGNANRIHTTTWSYDDDGDLIGQRLEDDETGDGTLDEVEVFTYERTDGLVTQVSATRMQRGTTTTLGVTTATYDGVCDWIDPQTHANDYYSLVP